MMRVLVTGASGFIGANAAYRFLKEGCEVHVFVRPGSNLWRLKPVLGKIQKHEADICDPKAVAKAIEKADPQHIYHLASYGTYPFHKNDELVMRTNILGSTNIFESAQGRKGLKKIINMGTSSEYGTNKKPMKETDAPEPETLYGASKLSQTTLARYFSRHGTVPIVTLRPFSVYGPYEEPGRFMSTLFLSCVRGTPFRLASPLARRDFVYIEDIIDIMKLAAKKAGIGGEIFNVGGGRDHSLGEIIKIAREATKSNIPILEGIGEKRTYDHDLKWEADISKARSVLGWRPNRSLAEGITLSFHWFKKNQVLYP